jgi:tRNA threonylcarbamoyladenosine biosynthesis protein TsaB
MSSSSLVLALDNSLDFLNLALAIDGCLLEERRIKVEGHSSEVLPTRVAQLLGEHKREARDLTAIIITLGPGSFTGVRVALAFCKGLSVGLGIPLVGVATPDVLAAPLAFIDDHYLCPLIDAKKGEVFFGLYRVSAGILTRVGDIRSSRPEDLLSQIELPCLCFGTGMAMCRRALDGTPGLLIVETGFEQVPAEALLRAGLARFEEGALGETKPIYGRRSEAEIRFRVEVP